MYNVKYFFDFSVFTKNNELKMNFCEDSPKNKRKKQEKKYNPTICLILKHFG